MKSGSLFPDAVTRIILTSWHHATFYKTHPRPTMAWQENTEDSGPPVVEPDQRKSSGVPEK